MKILCNEHLEKTKRYAESIGENGNRTRTALVKSPSARISRPIRSDSPSIIRTEAPALSAECFTTGIPTSPSPYSWNLSMAGGSTPEKETNHQSINNLKHQKL